VKKREPGPFQAGLKRGQKIKVARFTPHGVRAGDLEKERKEMGTEAGRGATLEGRRTVYIHTLINDVSRQRSTADL